MPRLDRTVFACPICERSVAPKAQRANVANTSAGFAGQIVSAFAYPLQRSAVIPLLAMVLFMWLAGFMPFFGGFLSAGVFFGYVFAVIRKSGYGDDQVPETQDFTDLFEFFKPLIVFYCTVIVSLIPLILIAANAGFPPPHGMKYVLAYLVTGVFPILYLPGAVAVIAHSRSWLAPFFPHVVFRIIMAAPGRYLGCVAFCVFFSFVQGGVVAVGALLRELPFPVLPSLVSIAMGLYLPLVIGRVLGLFVYSLNED